MLLIGIRVTVCNSCSAPCSVGVAAAGGVGASGDPAARCDGGET